MGLGFMVLGCVLGLFCICSMVNGGSVVLQLLFLSDDEGAATLGDEGIGQILDWCGDIGCGGFGVRRCLHRKKGYGRGTLPAVQDGLGGAVNRLGGDAGGCGLGAADLLGGAAGGGHQKYDGHRYGEGDVCVLHGVYHLLQR